MSSEACAHRPVRYAVIQHNWLLFTYILPLDEAFRKPCWHIFEFHSDRVITKQIISSRVSDYNLIYTIPTMSTPEEKYDLITRRLHEVFGGDSIKAILAEGRHPKGYWGASLVLYRISGILIFVINV